MQCGGRCDVLKRLVELFEPGQTVTMSGWNRWNELVIYPAHRFGSLMTRSRPNCSRYRPRRDCAISPSVTSWTGCWSYSRTEGLHTQIAFVGVSLGRGGRPGPFMTEAILNLNSDGPRRSCSATATATACPGPAVDGGLLQGQARGGVCRVRGFPAVSRHPDGRFSTPTTADTNLEISVLQLGTCHEVWNHRRLRHLWSVFFKTLRRGHVRRPCSPFPSPLEQGRKAFSAALAALSADFPGCHQGQPEPRSRCRWKTMYRRIWLYRQPRTDGAAGAGTLARFDYHRHRRDIEDQSGARTETAIVNGGGDPRRASW